MTSQDALEILDLQSGASAAEIFAAYKAKCRALTNPRGDDLLEPFYSVAELRQAYRVLTKSSETQNSPCKTCRGSGKVQSGFQVRACVACGGTGERK